MMAFVRACAATALLLAVAGGCATPQPLITKLVDGKLITTRSISPRAYEHATRAQLYEEEDRWEEAVEEYNLALGYDAKSPELYARLAEAHLEIDQVKLAQDAVDRSLAIEPTPDGIVASAHVHLQRGHPKAAARVLGDALMRMDPNEDLTAFERLTLERADAQVMALDLNGATATLESLLALSPASQNALYRQASILWPLGQFPAARRYLARLVEVEPDHIEARLLLARLLTMVKDAKNARAVYAQAFDRAEGDLAVAGLYATFLLTQGLQEEAQALADDLQVNDTDPETLRSRMELERAAGRLSRGLEMADAVLATSPTKDVVARVLLAKGGQLQAARSFHEAVRTYQAIPEGAASSLEARLLAAGLLREQGQIPEAQAVLDKISDLSPDPSTQSDISIAKALLAGSMGKLQQARQLLLSMPTEAGQQDRAQLAAAALEDKYGDWQQALKLTEAVLGRDPANVEALNLWAFVAAEHDHQLPLALSRAQAALSFDAGSAAIMDTLGWILFKQKRFERAAPFLEGAAQFEPNDPEILAHVAALDAQLGRATQAAEKVRLALTLSPEPRLKGKLEALLQRLANATAPRLGADPAAAPVP